MSCECDRGRLRLVAARFSKAAADAAEIATASDALQSVPVFAAGFRAEDFRAAAVFAARGIAADVFAARGCAAVFFFADVLSADFLTVFLTAFLAAFLTVFLATAVVRAGFVAVSFAGAVFFARSEARCPTPA